MDQLESWPMGQLVVAHTAEQGLVVGQLYQVTDVNVLEFSFGRYVHHALVEQLPGAGGTGWINGESLVVRNARQLVDPA